MVLFISDCRVHKSNSKLNLSEMSHVIKICQISRSNRNKLIKVPASFCLYFHLLKKCYFQSALHFSIMQPGPKIWLATAKCIKFVVSVLLPAILRQKLMNEPLQATYKPSFYYAYYITVTEIYRKLIQSMFLSSHVFVFWFLVFWSLYLHGFLSVFFRHAHLALQNVNKDYVILS